MSTWIRDWTSDDGTEWIEHKGGVSWDRAPRPRRWHFCRPQTRGLLKGADAPYWYTIVRCRCGAVSLDDPGFKPVWLNRNDRTK